MEIINKTIADLAREIVSSTNSIEVNMSGKDNSCSAEFVADAKQLPITTQPHALTGENAVIYALTIARKVREQQPGVALTVRYNGNIIYPTE